MKKEKYLMCIITVIISMILYTVPTQASSADHSTLEVEVGEYSEDILKYIQVNWENMFGGDELEEYVGCQIVVGEPFGIYNLDEERMAATKFPFYVNNKCIQIVDVFPDEYGNLTWSASTTEGFLQEIDDLRKREGKYRIQVRNTDGTSAPIREIVKVSDELDASCSVMPSTRESISSSDINQPIMVFDVSKDNLPGQVDGTNYPTSIKLPMEPMLFGLWA